MNDYLSESDICDRFIRPAMEKAGWNGPDQICRAYPLRAGMMVVRGNQAERDPATMLRADYVLFYKTHIPLAVVQAVTAQQAPEVGIQQAIHRARLLDVPFCFAGHGAGFVFHDATSATPQRLLTFDEFPSPAELWDRYCASKGWDSRVCQVAASDYHAPGKTPRYYQLNAINRTVQAVANGQNRVLLVMAAGTGKTYTAFQIIWRLWKSESKKRILFLADRNLLIDQAMVNDFRPFKGAMAKLSLNAKGMERIIARNGAGSGETGPAVRKITKQVNKSYEIYLSFCRSTPGIGEKRNIYRQFRPDFFDLIVVDECHRGSMSEDVAWRDILSYFTGASQVGFSTTPVERKDDVSNDYFGEPLYTYSLKQGMEDGYLAPYKIIRVDPDRDSDGGDRPSGAGTTDRHGQQMENSMLPGPRDQAAAAKITEYLQATDRYAKTIVFCDSMDHVARMRQALASANADLCAVQPGYVAQITGHSAHGKRELDNFTNPEKTYPVIVTTSGLLGTGIDAPGCRLIVLDLNMQSKAQYKQTMGRGTRLRPDLGKNWFTIIDFRRATECFADPDFDGDPVQLYEPAPGEPMAPPDLAESLPGARDGSTAPPGHPPWVTESLRDYTRIQLQKRFASLAQFLQTWRQAERKTALLQELQAHGLPLAALAAEAADTDPGLKDLDPFDLLLHVAYDQPTLTRRERVARIKKRKVFAPYSPMARRVLQALLDKYANEGITTMESNEILKLQPFTDLGSPVELVRSFGGRPQYLAALQALAHELYRAGDPKLLQ